MEQEPIPYNPLTKRNLAGSIVARLLNQIPQELPPPRFLGAGLYLIYYTGPFGPYKPIAAANKGGRFTQPIYVGKAVPAGARKGGDGLETPHGTALFTRLSNHAKSIQAARNLSIGDFRCRWLVLDEVFIPLGETLLISHYRPVWNLTVEGFGNNPPGGGRAKGKKPAWDVLHPGRAWADDLSAAVTEAQVIEWIRCHFATTPTPPGPLQ